MVKALVNDCSQSISCRLPRAILWLSLLLIVARAQNTQDDESDLDAGSGSGDAGSGSGDVGSGYFGSGDAGSGFYGSGDFLPPAPISPPYPPLSEGQVRREIHEVEIRFLASGAVEDFDDVARDQLAGNLASLAGVDVGLVLV